MDRVVTYLRDRLVEASTWNGLGVVTVASVALPYPWNILAFVFGSMGVLLKGGDGGNK